MQISYYRLISNMQVLPHISFIYHQPTNLKCDWLETFLQKKTSFDLALISLWEVHTMLDKYSSMFNLLLTSKNELDVVFFF